MNQFVVIGVFEISIGDPSNQYIYDLTWGDKDEAEKQADKKLREIKRPKKVLTIVGPYMPVVCGQNVEIAGIRTGINGTWTAKSIEHLL